MSIVSSRSARDVFDSVRFRADVGAHMNRWHLSMRELALSTDISASTVCELLRGTYAPSLMVACVLADVCDLSLDTYRKPPP